MFGKKLDSISFVSRQASDVFAGKITGDMFRGDATLLATMRALLPKRIKADEQMIVSICGISAASVCVAASEYSFTQELLIRNVKHSLMIRSVDGSAEHTANAMAMIDRRVPEWCAWLREQQDLEIFVKDLMNARFYIDEQNHRYIVIVERLDLRKYHFLAALLPRLTPWAFEGTVVSEFEKRLLKSLTEKTATNFELLIEEAYQNTDIRSMAITKLIGAYEKNARTAELNQATSMLEDVHYDIRNNREAYRNLIQRQFDCQVRIAGLQEMIETASDNSDLAEYIIRNKSITLVGVEDSEIELIVNTYLDMVDPDMYERAIENSRSYLHRLEVSGIFSDGATRRRLLDALFSGDPTLRLKVCGVYFLDARGSVATHSSYRYPPECSDRLPNPHLQYHACLGDHARLIETAIDHHDLIGAVEQCVASAKSMNINEVITAERFIEEIFSTSKRCIETFDGVSMTPEEAIAWLDENKDKEGETLSDE